MTWTLYSCFLFVFCFFASMNLHTVSHSTVWLTVFVFQLTLSQPSWLFVFHIGSVCKTTSKLSWIGTYLFGYMHLRYEQLKMSFDFFFRLYCPKSCLRDSRARVIGTKYYADVSLCTIIIKCLTSYTAANSEFGAVPYQHPTNTDCSLHPVITHTRACWVIFQDVSFKKYNFWGGFYT